MDEVELLRSWAGQEPPPNEHAINLARSVVRNTIETPGPRGAATPSRPRPQPLRGLAKVATLAAISTAAIMTQPHMPLGLPGHRALVWLALLLMMRLVGGNGWASAVGLVSAVGTLAIGRSPNGSAWGVLQYAVAGVGVDVFLRVRPALAQSPLLLAGLGGVLLALVGWITPISNSFVGGVALRGIWLSMVSMPGSAWVRLVSFDLAFGAGAGPIGYAMAWALNPGWRHLRAEGLAAAS